jgi:hypothetical protein
LAGNPNNQNNVVSAFSGVYPTRTVIVDGTTNQFCINTFTLTWNANGVPTEGQPITWWRAFTNPSQYVEPTNPTAADPQWNLIPQSIQGILYFHQEPYKTFDGGKDVYTLPDGTTRTSGSQMSDQAWSQLGQRVCDQTWPTGNITG